jgi:hypothetical protein
MVKEVDPLDFRKRGANFASHADRAGLIADDDFRLVLAALLRDPLGTSNVEETGSLDEALGRPMPGEWCGSQQLQIARPIDPAGG